MTCAKKGGMVISQVKKMIKPIKESWTRGYALERAQDIKATNQFNDKQISFKKET